MPSQLSSAGRQNFSMPPPLVVPSPKSPKLNPFSSPSPVHNPFMTIVESKDELWKTMAKDKLSDEEAAKSSALLSGVNNSNKKSRLASYGGGSSYFGDSGYYPSSFGQNDQAEAEEEGKNEDNKDSNNDGNNNNDEDDNDDQEGDDNNNNQQDQPSPGKMYTTYALPENVIVVTGEEQDECLLQLRVKLYRLGVKETGKSKKKGEEEEEEKKEEVKIDITAAEWIEVGIGPLKVLRQKEDEVAATEDSNNTDIGKQCSSSSSRLVMRREDKKGGIGKYTCNLF